MSMSLMEAWKTSWLWLFLRKYEEGGKVTTTHFLNLGSYPIAFGLLTLQIDLLLYPCNRIFAATKKIPI
jgi:hypothetical protein